MELGLVVGHDRAHSSRMTRPKWEQDSVGFGGGLALEFPNHETAALAFDQGALDQGGAEARVAYLGHAPRAEQFSGRNGLQAYHSACLTEGIALC
jgi:hypothetical protein